MNKNNIVELIVIFIITLFFSMFCLTFTNDEIWSYGFAYNIVTGLLPYTDFNMVITPLYQFLGSLFLLILGKSIISLLIMNSIICTIIFYLLKKTSNNYVYIVYTLFFAIIIPNYNLLCLLFLLILLGLEENKKNNDFLIGIVLGLTFLTKQNIGIYLCLPSLLTKDIKKILKRILAFLIPVSIFLIYLFITNSLNDFITYAFGGISSFAKDNIYISFAIFLIILSFIYLSYKYIKTKKIKYIYLLLFQLIAFPIFGTYHVLIAFIPVLNEFFSNLKFKIPKLFTKLTFCLFVILISVFSIYELKIEKKIINLNSEHFKYRVTYNIYNLDEIKTYLNSVDNVYIINEFAYLYKLHADIPITKYDLLNNGNLGKNGEEKIINDFEKICKNNPCSFLLLENEYDQKRSQTNKKIYNYVKKNYQYNNSIGNYSIYKNDVKK